VSAHSRPPGWTAKTTRPETAYAMARRTRCKDRDRDMPIQAVRDDTRRRITVTFEAAVTASDVNSFITSEPPVPGGDQPYDILVDLRYAHVDLETSAQAQSLAVVAERQDPNRRRGRVAVVADDDATFGIARMYAAYRERAGIAVEVFRRLDQAEIWLTMTAEP
jgi:hypothetical protein